MPMKSYRLYRPCLYLFLLGSFLTLFPKISTAGLEYPELQVTPSASERVNMEADQESFYGWLGLWPFQTSALTTLAASIAISDASNRTSGSDPSNSSGQIGAIISSSWIVGTLAMAAFYQPYASTQARLKVLPHSTDRQRLIKERLAEEAIESMATFGRRLIITSILTQTFANTWMIIRSQGGTSAFALSITGAVLSWLPLIFQTHWQKVAEVHDDYKKRIYGPVAGPIFVPDALTGSLSPGIGVTLTF